MKAQIQAKTKKREHGWAEYRRPMKITAAGDQVGGRLEML
jgi:hypothetical protein